MAFTCPFEGSAYFVVLPFYWCCFTSIAVAVRVDSGVAIGDTDFDFLVFDILWGWQFRGASGNPNGTPAGTYTLTVTVVSGTATQSTRLTLIVQ
jgi:hypothetical protein